MSDRERYWSVESSTSVSCKIILLVTRLVFFNFLKVFYGVVFFLLNWGGEGFLSLLSGFRVDFPLSLWKNDFTDWN